MTETQALIAAEIDAEIAAERHQSAAHAQEHPDLLDALATEADLAWSRFDELLLEGGRA